MRISSLIMASTVLLFSQAANADEALRKKVSDAFTICSGDGVITKANAPAVITRCNNALVTMVAFHAASQFDNLDKNWFNFNGGAVLILLAGAYTIENDNKLNKNACQNALNANRMWSDINAAPGSKLDIDIKNDALFNKLVPLCKKIFKTD